MPGQTVHFVVDTHCISALVSQTILNAHRIGIFVGLYQYPSLFGCVSVPIMALRLHFHDSTFVAIRDLNTWGLQQSGGSSFPGAATLGIGQIPIFWKGVDRFTNNGNNRRSLKRWIYSLPLQAKDEGGQSMLVPASPTTVFGIYIYIFIYTHIH